MIVDRPSSHFIFVLSTDHVVNGYNYIRYDGNPLTNKEYLQFWGKWVFFGEPDQLSRLAREMDPFVEEKIVPAAKYDREVIEAFALGQCVMCVYCDFRQREAVWEVLASIGVTDKMWVFEKETMERWMPGGHLLEKWIAGRAMSPEAADRVREDAQKTFEKMFANPDAEFKGVMQ